MQVRDKLKKHEMRPFISYVHLVFPGTAKYKLLKLVNICENQDPSDDFSILVVQIRELFVYFCLHLGRICPQAEAEAECNLEIEM